MEADLGLIVSMYIYRNDQYINQGSSVHVFRSGRSRGINEPTHTHEFIEILYVLSGHATNVVDGQAYECGHGDMIFIHYGSTHSFVSDENYSYFNICFSPEAIGTAALTPENAFALMSLTAFNEMRCDAGGGKISFGEDERQEIEFLLNAMLAEEKAKPTAWHTVVENYLNILITKMLRKNELSVSHKELDGMWRELFDYIDANLDSKLTLTDLAQKCFYNPSYFSRIFKEKFSMSPVEYINRKRVEHAIRLLRESKLSVDEISARVGFSDRSNFYHAFSKYTDLSPADYRKSTKK